MPEELYDEIDIETAFFNYNSDGSEISDAEYKAKKEDWHKFWDYLRLRATERKDNEVCGGC